MLNFNLREGLFAALLVAGPGCAHHMSLMLHSPTLGNILLTVPWSAVTSPKQGTSRHAQYNLQTMSNTSLLLQCHNDKSPTFSCIDQGPITVTASISLHISSYRSGLSISEYNICTPPNPIAAITMFSCRGPGSFCIKFLASDLSQVT